MSNNFIKDTDTFKNERSCIAVINVNMEGPVNNFFRVWYNLLSKNLFKNVYEMMVIFVIIYFNNNQFFKVWEELRKMMYNPIDKTIDIY